MKVYKIMENGIQIVEYDKSMASAIADMWNKSGEGWGGNSSTMTPEQVIANYEGSSNFNVFIALNNGEAVGLATFSRYWADPDTAYVGLLNVRPDYHGKKIGKELTLACVNRTIEMGYPRVDIHTWSGNTKAVPVYKKCGFLWEDRGDTTHLSNYIPTVLKTELFSEFFETADWYTDSTSTKVIEILPDGKKINKFEIYGYSWAKDGKNLAVNFEKTGRRISFVETDDYKIELMAENHELAFGLNYNCIFKVENKSGKDLNIKIAGKSDKGIKFEEACETKVDKYYEFIGEFYVEPIEKNVDIWRMHPCILADVYVNGKHVEFGLGIETKFPLIIDFFEKRHSVTRPGVIQDVYINVKSSLTKPAEVKFTILENNHTRFFDNNSFIVNVNPDETAMLSAKEEILKLGYEKLDINYEITLDGGNKINFSKPFHLVNQGVDACFSYETEHNYCAVNGVWQLYLNKRGNFLSVGVAAGNGGQWFSTPKLGKPYSDEFDRINASNIKMYKCDNLMVVEYDLISEDFKGAVLTVITEFSANGVISHRLKVTNNSDKTISSIYLQDQFWSSVGRRSVFHYDNEYHEITDNTTFGFSDLHSEKIDENWIFDNSSWNKAGMYWAREYKPTTKWGDTLMFDHNIGELAPGAAFETKPSVYMSGIFQNIREFRNYVIGIDEKVDPYTIKPLDININGRNPFINTETANIKAAIKNDRFKIYKGDLLFNSPDGLFEKSAQTNPDGETVELNAFDVKLNKKNPGIYLTELDLKFSIEKNHKRALFIADRATKVSTDEKDGIFTINNGKICYKVSPEYFDSVYSLKYGENEWLFSKYPKHEPYSWLNPFIGGIHLNLWNMNSNLLLREKRTAEFVTVKDSFDTEWTGIKIITAINEFTDHKGLTYETYYVTQPSLPVLCCFVRFINNTGGYKHMGYDMTAYISCKEQGNLNDIYALTRDDKEEYRARMGDGWYGSDKFIRMSFEGEFARPEKLYVFYDPSRNSGGGGLGVGSDINQCSINTNGNTNYLLNNMSHTFRPVFFMLTEKELTFDSVIDLERVFFTI